MRIIWALDAFEDQKELNQKMANFLEHLHTTAAHIETEPVYLLREHEIILPTYEVPAWVADHSKTAESLFKEVLSDYNLTFLKEGRVIPHSSTSHAGSAEVLSEYALRTQADLILVGSHGRQGFQRFILGSFAESLLMQSEIPVCVMGLQSTQTKTPKNILFPTEFGDHSKENFKHLLKMAKDFHAGITLLHAITRPIESLFDLDTRPRVYNYNGRMLSIEQIIQEQVESQTQRAQLWVDWARSEGVEAQFVINSSFKPIDELILKTIEGQEADFVVMEAQSGPLSSALLGSITRNVARKAHCPVYILPRHYYDKKKEPSLAPEKDA